MPIFRYLMRFFREYREFERTSTTVVNAYVGRKVGGYVRDLKGKLEAIGFKGNLSSCAPMAA